MRNHIIFKFLAVFLCAVSLLGAVGSGLAIFVMTELGLNNRSLEEAYTESVQYTAENLASELTVRYASRELGGASEALLDDYYGYYWLGTNFDLDKVGYRILDADRNIVEERELENIDGTVADYELPVEGGSYIQVQRVLTQEEFDELHTPVTEPVYCTTEPCSEMTVYNAVPAEGSKITQIYVTYADGYVRDYGANGNDLGMLLYSTPDQLQFLVQSDYANIAQLFEDFRQRTPVSMLFVNTNGEVVLEISDADCVLEEFSENHGDAYFILRPMENAVQLPTGSIYDAIPAEGQYVSQCTVTYADGWAESVGGSPDIGYLSYDGDGYVVFAANSPGILEYRTEPVTYISFHDEFDNLVYEASDPEGAGFFSLEGDTLVFRSRDTGSEAEEPAATGSGIYIYDDVPPLDYPVFQISLWLQGSDSALTIEKEDDHLGVVNHDSNGNVCFTARDWKDFVFSKPAQVVYILMRDADGRILYESYDEGFAIGQGTPIGVFAYNKSGQLVFSRDSGESALAAAGVDTVDAVPIEELPSETVPTIPAAQILDTVTVRFQPNEASKVTDMLEIGTIVPLLETTTLMGVEWGKIESGWIQLDPETVAVMEIPEADGYFELTEETVPDVTEAETPEETAVPTEEVLASETAPVMTDETPLSTAPTLTEGAADATIPQAATETAGIALAEENGQFYGYYDYDAGETMYAEYTYEDMPAYTVQLHMAQGATANQFVWVLVGYVDQLKDNWVFLMIGSLLLFAITAVYLCCSAGRRPGTTEVRANGLNCIPLDLYLCAAIGGVALCFLGIVEGSDYLMRQDIQTGILFSLLMAFAASLLIVGFCFAFAAQVKTPGGYWWRNSLCGRSLRLIAWLWHKFVHFCGWLWDKYDEKIEPLLVRMFKALWKLVKFFFHTLKKGTVWVVSSLAKGTDWLGQRFTRFFSLLPLTWQFLLTGFVLVFLLYIMMRTYKVGYILLGFGIFFGVILYAASAFGTLLESARRMRKGDLDFKVDDRLLIGSFQDFADELNGLADVAVVAAQKQLKSERMKTELITNVSHDIKTPLTSIINYVDLMEKPHSPEEQQAYLEVLSRQSQRLKKLIDDLMELSKASTGNLAVDISEVNAVEAINQALGEFADKLDKVQLTPVFRQPDQDIRMLADGRLVWRVLSNLLSNAVKYALPGTRLYIDLMELEGKVVLSMKNISRDSLNIDADELVERFVRGDSSRNTEGSGLGLNIAQSLMELQKGKLELLVDGDLFKVTLIFPGA